MCSHCIVAVAKDVINAVPRGVKYNFYNAKRKWKLIHDGKLLKNGFVIGSNDELHIDVKAIIDATTLRTGESDDIKVSDNFGFKEDQLDTDKNVFATIKVEVLDENGIYRIEYK